jgi:glutamyl-tRNA synthetase
MKDFEKKARGYALKNALAYNGAANSGSVISALFNEGMKREEVKKYSNKINEIVKEINSLSVEEQEKEFEKIKDIVSERHGREGLEELPNVKKSGVVMRFAPSPSGPLHIAHAATACISFLYVKKYGGKFYVRIEDTNPENIYLPAYDMIKRDSDWLFDGIAEIVIQSDRMELYYKYAKELIKKAASYVCTCSGDEFREYSSKMRDCPCRNLSIKENLNRWGKMFDGFREGEAVLRFKSNMQDKNPAMRDFPLARINTTNHPRVGSKYRVWPLMNLAVIVDDMEMGVTHIIRGKDHMDNAKRQEMIYKIFGKKAPWNAFLGRYKFTDMELSATQMRKDVESGKYSGWDDPRIPTIISLRKQGYRKEAFWRMAEKVGLAENDKVLDKREYFTLLKGFNRINA